MERKDLNLAYIYLMAIFAIGIAIANVISFFGGIGFAFVGASVLLILAAKKILNSAYKKRFGDILILIIIEFLMLIVLFFAYDFNINGITNKFPFVMRNICSIYSIFALGYTAFRYFSEIKGKKYKFVEYILGNHTSVKGDKKTKSSKEVVRKNRELENGTLEPKPITMQSASNGYNAITNQRPELHQQGINTSTNTDNAVNQNGNIGQLTSAQADDSKQSAENSSSDKNTDINEIVKNHPNYWD